MKINWKLRLRNKITLTAISLGILALVYQVLGLLGIVPAIAESQLAQTAVMVIDLLVLLGVVVDPTTEGISDSAQAMAYEAPKPREISEN
jgi:phi LC3 family holin